MGFLFPLLLYILSMLHPRIMFLKYISLFKMPHYSLFKILQWLPTIFRTYLLFFTFKICVFWFTPTSPNLMVWLHCHYPPVTLLISASGCPPLLVLRRTQVVTLTLLYKTGYFSFFSIQMEKEFLNSLPQLTVYSIVKNVSFKYISLFLLILFFDPHLRRYLLILETEEGRRETWRETLM